MTDDSIPYDSILKAPDAAAPKTDVPQSINDTLKERGLRYGRFYDHARISQRLKDVGRGVPGWERLDWDQKEAIEMVFHKIARLLNGDCNFVDSWHDIVGYTQLVENRLLGLDDAGAV